MNMFILNVKIDLFLFLIQVYCCFFLFCTIFVFLFQILGSRLALSACYCFVIFVSMQSYAFVAMWKSFFNFFHLRLEFIFATS